MLDGVLNLLPTEPSPFSPLQNWLPAWVKKKHRQGIVYVEKLLEPEPYRNAYEGVCEHKYFVGYCVQD